MEKINVKQLQDIEIGGEKIGIKEAFEGIQEFAENVYGLVDDLNTKVNTLEEGVEDKVSNERLDEFMDDSGTTISLETWAGNVETAGGQIMQSVEAIGNTIQNLPYTYATKAQLADYVSDDELNHFAEELSESLEEAVGTIEGKVDAVTSRLDEFNPDSEASEGSIEKWASTVGGGGLPEVTPEDAGKYFKVDENGNVITYEPADSIGDGDFYGNPDSFVTAEAIVELVQQYYDFITGGSEVTEGCLGTKVQEIKERLEDFIDNEIIMGDPIHFTSDPDNHNLIDGTYEITGVNRVDVIRIRELNTGAFDDLIGITFLNLEDYPSWRPEGADFMMQMLNAERTRWKIEYGDTYYGDPVAWDVELIPYEVRKRIPNSNESGYQILEELHRESW